MGPYVKYKKLIVDGKLLQFVKMERRIEDGKKIFCLPEDVQTYIKLKGVTFEDPTNDEVAAFLQNKWGVPKVGG